LRQYAERAYMGDRLGGFLMAYNHASMECKIDSSLDVLASTKS